MIKRPATPPTTPPTEDVYQNLVWINEHDYIPTIAPTFVLDSRPNLSVKLGRDEKEKDKPG